MNKKFVLISSIVATTIAIIGITLPVFGYLTNQFTWIESKKTFWIYIVLIVLGLLLLISEIKEFYLFQKNKK